MNIEELFEKERNEIIKQMGKEENQVPTFEFVLHYAYECQREVNKRDRKRMGQIVTSYWWKHIVETAWGKEMGVVNPYCSNKMFKMVMYEVFPHGEKLSDQIQTNESFVVCKEKLYRSNSPLIKL